MVATTRPETMLGDTGVAVKPGGREVSAPGRKDLHPAHHEPGEIPHCGPTSTGHGVRHWLREDDPPPTTPTTFEVGLRHNLDTIRVIDDNGTINEKRRQVRGMDRYECRKAIG